ncbi:hypothetical protein [Halopenitus persicus]|uniref:hypothetical protein n=1 Tax=Halopenitus persicus TaxID=1048396 RepID=UPI000BBA55D5|nr:hypothetical protein [Halopenitus persicus]
MSDDTRYYIGDPPRHSDETTMTEYRLRWPETGGIKTLLEVALVYHLVTVATPVLRAQAELLNPAIVPDPFTTVLYALLWIGIVAVVVWLFRSESLVSTHRFYEYDSVRRDLESDLPDRGWVRRNVGLAVLGGGLAGMTYERFVAAFLHVIDLLVIVLDEFQWALTLTDGLFVAGFLGGFTLFTIGVDRLVVGALRRYVLRSQTPS